jgi:pyrroloquinoline quinone biosynthesis protein D
MRAPLTADSRPALVSHVRLQRDAVRQQWVVQAPERLFVLDDVAHAVLSRCGEGRSVAEIAAELSREFEAPVEEIRGDVLELLQDLADKGVVHDQRT